MLLVLFGSLKSVLLVFSSPFLSVESYCRASFLSFFFTSTVFLYSLEGKPNAKLIHDYKYTSQYSIKTVFHLKKISKSQSYHS